MSGQDAMREIVISFFSFFYYLYTHTSGTRVRTRVRTMVHVYHGSVPFFGTRVQHYLKSTKVQKYVRTYVPMVRTYVRTYVHVYSTMVRTIGTFAMVTTVVYQVLCNTMVAS